MKDYILRLKGIVPAEVCDSIVERYSTKDGWSPGRVGQNVVNVSLRDCDQRKLEGVNDELFVPYAKEALRQYMLHHEYCDLDTDTGYTLCRYREGQGYPAHVDVGQSTRHRVLSCTFWLNDDYEGGEMEFPTAGLKGRCDKGDALVFPSNFVFPHAVLPVTKGTRYSIVTWFM